jgi:1-hydroxycarotenoid 3,4-desaturase
MSLRVAVVGGGIGGMTAAGELAVLGHDVTLFEASPRLGGKCGSIHKNGITLDTGPTLLTLPSIIRETFTRLSAMDLLPPLTPLDPQCEYRWQDGTHLRFGRSLKTSNPEADAIAEGEAEALKNFYAEAQRIWEGAGAPYLEKPYEGFVPFMVEMMRRGPKSLEGARIGTLASLARKHFRSKQLRQFAGRFATYAGASPFKASETFALIPYLEHTEGVFHPRGGMGAVAKALEIAIVRLGVSVHVDTPVTWFREGSHYRVGVRQAHPELTVQTERSEAKSKSRDLAHFDALVVNVDPLKANGHSEQALSLSGYVLLLEADRRLRLPHHAISFSNDERAEFAALFSGQFPEDPTLYVCHPAQTDASAAPEDRSGVYVMINAAPLPSDDVESPWEHTERARDLCLRRLKRDFPEVENAELHILDERTPVDLAKLGAPRGSIYGYLPHGALGTFKRPPLRGKTPGLYFAGGGTHPGGGVPMVMLSGRFAAELLHREVPS